MAVEFWGTDAPISQPTIPPLPILVDLGGTGFAFTAGGIAHMIDANALETLQNPTFSPPISTQTT